MSGSKGGRRRASPASLCSGLLAALGRLMLVAASAGVARLGGLLAAIHSAVAVAVGATAVAMLLMLALLMLTVLLMVLLGRRGLGGDRRGEHQRQSGEKNFHY